MLRYRGKKITALNIVKELDSFPKVQEEIYEPSTYDNIILTALVALFGLWLIISQIQYVLQERYTYKFVTDIEYATKLQIHIDITVASVCDSIGADIVDTTGQNMMLFGELKTDDTWWEMTEKQQNFFNEMRNVNEYLRGDFHSMKDLLMLKGFRTYINTIPIFPVRDTLPDTLPDACRIHGSLILNKVTGNFHITPGKSITVPGGHVHLSSPFFDSVATNFSHRIHQFSFGIPIKGIIYPLEGELHVSRNESDVSYKYFIDVVSTDINTHLAKVKTYQYSAKDIQRIISHESGSHGMPASSFGGVFILFKLMKIIIDKIRKNIYCSHIVGNSHSREKS
ncbi:Hypothetical protein CINCED_3A015851 [Cinara cedri]|uniref:Endoplasmic reticulum-Golgi intermediate compartment protein 2 n=1 Tax=Cinara cedri TaxID=506608 RepID=A0A5E4NNK2_9HEMI|nr:Hypothetical protein CINCED_3A015851 [Cinara cedri]